MVRVHHRTLSIIDRLYECALASYPARSSLVVRSLRNALSITKGTTDAMCGFVEVGVRLGNERVRVKRRVNGPLSLLDNWKQRPDSGFSKAMTTTSVFSLSSCSAGHEVEVVRQTSFSSDTDARVCWPLERSGAKNGFGIQQKSLKRIEAAV
jgi:hypothetical protein